MQRLKSQGLNMRLKMVEKRVDIIGEEQFVKTNII